jgi:hypothetical protein
MEPIVGFKVFSIKSASKGCRGKTLRWIRVKYSDRSGFTTLNVLPGGSDQLSMDLGR